MPSIYYGTKEHIKFKLSQDTKINNFYKNIVGKILPKKHILKLGSILFPNNESIYPYNIFIEDNSIFKFRVAIFPDTKIDEFGLREGLVIFGNGKYLVENINVEIDIQNRDLIEWQTDYEINELIKMCKEKHVNNENNNEVFKIVENGGQYLRNIHLLNKELKISNQGNVEYDGIKQHVVKDFKNYSCVKLEEKCELLKIHWLVADAFIHNPNIEIYTDVHHINGQGSDNKKNNLLRVSKEQHASIEQFMWKKYIINDETMLVYKNEPVRSFV